MSKFNKNILFVLIILSILIIIPSSFASDSNGNDTLADSIDADSNSIYVNVEAQDGGDGSRDNPYNDISSAIENFDTNINSNIYVKNGTYTFKNQVTVNKDVTIVGESNEGVIFDGNNTSALFKVTSSNVQFNSLSFVNGLGDSGWYSGYAAAIDASGRHLIVDNCIFKNNDGGAISSGAGGSEGNPADIQIKNSKFINNTKDGWAVNGGALTVGGIYAYLNMTNCVFINNTAPNGGAVSICNGRKESFIVNCEFIGNTAGEGSAIYFSNAYDATIKNCNFEDNVADNDSGVIDFTGSYYQRKLSVGKNTFSNNTPEKEYNVDEKIELVYLDNNDKLSGEDIETMDVGSDVNFTVTLTDSSGNPISGKLITINLTDLFDKTTTYSSFTNENGQAIISLVNQTAGTYTAVSTFAGDETWDGVSTLNSIKIKAEHSFNIAFNESIVKVNAGDSHLVLATTCDEYMRKVVFFSTCTISWRTHSGGVRTTTNVGISNGEFVVDVLNFDLSTQAEYYYINFTAASSSAVQQTYAYGTLLVDTSIPLPPVDENIDVIYVDQKIGSDELGDGSESSPLATVQVALYLNEIFGGNKTIFVKEGVYNISNYEIYADVNVVGEKGKTIFRQHTGDDGMLYLDNGAVTKFTNVTFMDGDAGTYSLYNAVIVVRYPGASAYFDGCEFYNNKASSDGMMYVAAQANAYINNCIFANNIARTFNPAGAVHVQDAYLVVNNSYFYNNTATEGAAIFVGGDTYALIENTMFYKNIALNDTSALSGGGAIFVNNWNTHIYNCSFVENYAELNGGAIYILTGEIEIQKSLFINNRVEKSGSGIGTAIACDSGYPANVYVDHSILYSNSYGNLIHINPSMDEGLENEVILEDNYWGSNYKISSNYNNYIVIEASTEKAQINKGDLVEITVEFKENSKALSGSVHDYALNLTSTLGKCDADSITLVDNVAKFNYFASNEGNETITFTNGGTRYTFKFEVGQSAVKADVNANLTVNDDKTLITAQLPTDIVDNVTIIVDNIQYSVKPNNGVVELPISLMPGNHTAFLTYGGDDKYNGEMTDKINFTVAKFEANINIFIEDVVVGEDIIAEITANANLTCDVLVTVNNKTYTVKVVNGAGSSKIDDLSYGTYEAKAVFEGNEYFLSDEDATEFIVSESDIQIIYVSQTRGNDTSADGSFENPYATVSKALERNNRLGGNRTVIIEKGNYVLNRFAISKDVTVKADGKVIIAPSANTNHLYIGGNVKVNLDGLTFINGKCVVAGSIDMGSDNAGNIGKELIISNCTFINNNGPVGVISTYANTTIISSSFINNTATGKTGFNQAIISVQDNTIDLKYNIFLNNDYESDIIVSRVNGVANDNFWGDNNKPGDISNMLEVKTWAVAIPSIDDDVRTKTNYNLTVEFKQTADGNNYSDLEGKLQDLTFNIEANNGAITPSDVVISNNIGIVNYMNTIKGSEEIRLNLYGNTVAKLNFFVDVPEYDKIYVSKTGNDLTGNGSSENPLASIEKALAQNKATGGDKTIIIKPGTYTEHDLVIDTDVVIIGEDAIIDAANLGNIFTISAKTNISNVTFTNAKTAIKHNSGELTIDGSEFKNNEKAIVSDDKLNIENTTFTKNTAGVIEVNAETSIKNSAFESNDVSDVVKSTTKITIDNSTFTKGGAIDIVGGEAVIKNNEFNGNDAAIIAHGNVEITNNEFNNDSISLVSSNATVSKNKNTVITIENSKITNTIVTFLNGETVIANNGTIKLNATVTDDMGNKISGGKLTFKDGETILGIADIKNGIATLNKPFSKGNHTITGIFDSDKNAKIVNVLLRIDVDYYWFINGVGYETLKDAIEAANLGDVIKGVAGTYTIPKLAIGHRYFSLEPWEVIKSVTITSLTDDPVTLEGDGNQLFFVDIGSELTLKNIILANGGNSYEDGGAVEAMYGTNLTVINCTFIDNSAENGGAIYSLGGNVEIKDSLFDNNFALVGGAIDVIGHYGELLSIENCTFINNFGFFGGAVYNGGGNIEISESLFYNNVANVGGALMMRSGSTSVENTDFIANSAHSDEENYTTLGGAIHNYLADLYLTNVNFINNTADKGGALELENGLYGDIYWTTFDNCTFVNNTALNGGAIYLGDHFDPYVNITDSKFEANSAQNGSAISDNFGHLIIKNTEFIKNIGDNLINVTGAYISGEGFSPDEIFYGELTIINSTFKENNVTYDVITNDWCIVKISDSTFDGENTIINNYDQATLDNNKATNTKNYVIINNAELSLDNNDFDTAILNNKDILTQTYVVVLDNETKSVAIGENYTLTAVVCDDNGNIIESGKLQFVIGNVTIQSKLENQTFKAEYTVTAGSVSVGAIFEDTGLKLLTIKTGTIEGKYPANLNVKVGNVKVGDDAVITVTMDAKATGNVTIKVGNNTYDATINNGVATLTISNLENGTYLVEVSYPGDENYAPAQQKAEFNVSKVSEYDLTIDVGKKDTNTADITVTLPDDATGNVNITVNGKTYNTNVVNGIATITADNMVIGQNNITVSYAGDKKYDPINKSDVFDGDKKASYVVVSADDIQLGQDAIITITVPSDATGNVIVTVNGKDYFANINNGKATISVSGLVSGQYNVHADYSGDEDYLNSINTTTFKVTDKTVKESVIALTIEANGTIVGVLRDIGGNGVAGALISYTIDGNNKATITTNDNGQFTIQSVNGKEYFFKFDGNDDVLSSIAIVTVNANNVTYTTTRKNVYIEVASAFTRVANDYYAGERGAFFYGILKDSDGNVLANKTVSIAVNGPIYNVTTDSQGRAGLQVNFMNANVYTYALSFAGDDEYNASPLASSKLTITKKKTSISASAKKYKVKSTKKYTVTLKTSKNPYNGKTYLKSGKKLTLKVKGKTYTAKINSKGKATFTLKLTKKGKFTAKIKFAGDKTYKASSKSVKITIK